MFSGVYFLKVLPRKMCVVELADEEDGQRNVRVTIRTKTRTRNFAIELACCVRRTTELYNVEQLK